MIVNVKTDKPPSVLFHSSEALDLLEMLAQVPTDNMTDDELGRLKHYKDVLRIVGEEVG